MTKPAREQQCTLAAQPNQRGEASADSDEMIKDEDLKVEALQWPRGGQHVGVRTGVRVTHLPTGLIAECEVERSQHRNRSIAIDMIVGALTSPHYLG